MVTGIGEQHHPVSTKNAEAQQFFDQGLRYIYAFNHDEAARSFQRAADLDPKRADLRESFEIFRRNFTGAINLIGIDMFAQISFKLAQKLFASGAILGALRWIGMDSIEIVTSDKQVAGEAPAVLQWIARGTGSGLRGHALVDALAALGKHVPALSAGRLTVLWYLVPALGAVSWIVYGLVGARSRTARVVAALATVTVFVAAGAFRHLAGTARLGWGPKVALLGGVMLSVGAWAPEAWLRARRRRYAGSTSLRPEGAGGSDSAGSAAITLSIRSRSWRNSERVRTPNEAGGTDNTA